MKLNVFPLISRWFAILYLVCMFFVLPSVVLGLSLAGPAVFLSFLAPSLAVLFLVVAVNVLQSRAPRCLPSPLRTWHFLPLWLRSLEPLDGLIAGFCCCCSKYTTVDRVDSEEAMHDHHVIVVDPPREDLELIFEDDGPPPSMEVKSTF